MNVHDTEVEAPRKGLLTITQVSEFLQVPIGTLYQWRHRGYGPPAKRLGRSLRYEATKLRRWLDEEVE